MAELADWIERHTGHKPGDLALFERALTHSSRGDENYERLEFLGDRVLGLVIADWLYELFPGRARGQALAPPQRAGLALDLRRGGARPRLGGQMRLGKQARDDGAFDSDNVLGDIVES
jgi:ribonuclease-3